MREYATCNRSLSTEGATELHRTIGELTRLRKLRSSRSTNNADINNEIRQLERRCEEIVSHRR